MCVINYSEHGQPCSLAIDCIGRSVDPRWSVYSTSTVFVAAMHVHVFYDGYRAKGGLPVNTRCY